MRKTKNRINRWKGTQQWRHRAHHNKEAQRAIESHRDSQTATGSHREPHGATEIHREGTTESDGDV